MTRGVRSSVLPLPISSRKRSFGNSGVRFSNRTLFFAFSGFFEIDFADLEQGENIAHRPLVDESSPRSYLRCAARNRRIWLGDT